MRTGDLIASQHSFLTTEAGKAKTEMEELVTTTKSRAEAATSQDAVTAIKDWAEKEEQKTEAPPDTSDTSMSLELLKTWVLEHAGDEEDAASDTSEEQWERAVEHAYGHGRELENHPEVFAYQTRGEWAKAGLVHAAESDAMIAKVRELVPGAEDPASVVEAYFHDKRYTFTSAADPEALARYVTERNFGAGVAEWGKQAIRDGKFRFECTLDVTTADGTCYVDEWNFEIFFLSDEAKEWSVRLSGADSAAFDVEPD